MMNEVVIGVFFDGTGNNKWVDEDLGDGSRSNVVKLHALYQKSRYKVHYEEGVGTRKYTEHNRLSEEELAAIRANQLDKQELYSTANLALGVSDVHAALASMMNKVDEEIKNILKEDPNAVIKVDTFGFSRGAATARSFVNNFNSQYHDYPNVTMDFVGLFDTVASIGTKHNLYQGGHNLNLNQNSADQIVQLTALNEFRYNFPLSSLKDSHGQLCENMKEIPLYGAHSDIGGGYADQHTDFMYAREAYITVPISYKDQKIAQMAQQAAAEDLQVKLTSEQLSSPGMVSLNFVYGQEVERTNELGKVGLYTMVDEISKHGRALEDMAFLGKDAVLTEDLLAYKDAVLRGEDIAPYRDIAEDYVNLSGSRYFLEEDEVFRGQYLGDKLPNMNQSDGRTVYDNVPEDSFQEIVRQDVFYSRNDGERQKQLDQLREEAEAQNCTVHVLHMDERALDTEVTYQFRKKRSGDPEPDNPLEQEQMLAEPQPESTETPITESVTASAPVSEREEADPIYCWPDGTPVIYTGDPDLDNYLIAMSQGDYEAASQAADDIAASAAGQKTLAEMNRVYEEELIRQQAELAMQQQRTQDLPDMSAPNMNMRIPFHGLD